MRQDQPLRSLRRRPAPAGARPSLRRRALLRAGLWLPAAVSAGAPRGAAAQETARRILIVHSFGRDFAPFDMAIATFRRELASRSPQPVVFFEAALDAVRAIGPAEEAAFVTYLVARFSEPPPDLVVSSGGPAARFLLANRAKLFTAVPILLTAFEARAVPGAALQAGDGMVVTTLDLPSVFANIVRVLPATRTIAVVIGDTPLERFWRRQLERDGAFLADRVRIVWYDGLTLGQMKERIAALPPDSAVFYASVLADGAGVPYERRTALAELRRIGSVPIFGIYEGDVGEGVVGGPINSQTRVGLETAQLALRLLGAASPAAPQAVPIGMDAPLYDARELRRWDIDASRLPPGSSVRFGEPSVWARYRREIIAASGVITAQAALITALLVQRARRRAAELEARALGGRLISAYEDEGRRLARELHDDVTQRLAGVAIETAALGRLGDGPARQAAEQSIGNELAALSRDVHALSYRLHPTVVDDLGLGEALRAACAHAARRGTVDVRFESDGVEDATRGERALCLFRVAQEALRNALRHAQARQVRVLLRSESDGTSVTVVDDGIGFDPAARRDHACLGLASMRERVALLGGQLEIRSRRGEETRVRAWLPTERPA